MLRPQEPTLRHNESMEVRPLDDRDQQWLMEFMTRTWGFPVVSISGAHNPGELPGFVALRGDQRLGVITYRLADEACEVVTINSLQENQGVGTALLEAVKHIAAERALRLWLSTTEDNANAIRFYESRGMTRQAVHRDFIELVRGYKPVTDGGYRDAIEFSY